LATLLETLSGESPTVYGRLRFPADLHIQRLANLNVVFTFIKQYIQLVDITPQDILDGDEQRTLDLVWCIMEFFSVEMINESFGTDIQDYDELKEGLLAWCQEKTSPYELSVPDLTEGVADGRVFLALMNDANTQECPYEPFDDPADTLELVFDLGEELYGLQPFMDPRDHKCTLCEHATVIYLVSLYLVLPSALDDLIMRIRIYLKVMTWWRRVRPAVLWHRTLCRARIASWAKTLFRARWGDGGGLSLPQSSSSRQSAAVAALEELEEEPNEGDGIVEADQEVGFAEEGYHPHHPAPLAPGSSEDLGGFAANGAEKTGRVEVLGATEPEGGAGVTLSQVTLSSTGDHDAHGTAQPTVTATELEELRKKAGMLPAVMGKFSELQSYTKTLTDEYEGRIEELDYHIEQMTQAEEDSVARIEMLEQRLSESMAENQELRSGGGGGVNSASGLQLTKYDGRHAQQEQEELFQRITDLERELLDRDNELDDARRQINAVEDEVAEVRGVLENVTEENEGLRADLDARDNAMAENEERLEDTEEHLESLSLAIVETENKVQELTDILEAERRDRLEAEEAAQRLEDGYRDVDALLQATKLDAAQKVQDLEAARTLIEEKDQHAEALSTALTEAKSLNGNLPLEAIEQMQTAAKNAVLEVDQLLEEMGGHEHTRGEISQLQARYDGSTLVDEVLCLQRVSQLLGGLFQATARDLRRAAGGGASLSPISSGPRAREVSNEALDAASPPETSALSSTGEIRDLRAELAETETALAAATSKWMLLEQEKEELWQTTRKINRHATETLRSGYENGLLVSSVTVAMRDLNAVRLETIHAGLGLPPTTESKAGPFAFLEYRGQEERAEVLWAEELIQMLCTEIDGLRRVLQQNDALLHQAGLGPESSGPQARTTSPADPPPPGSAVEDLRADRDRALSQLEREKQTTKQLRQTLEDLERQRRTGEAEHEAQERTLRGELEAIKMMLRANSKGVDGSAAAAAPAESSPAPGAATGLAAPPSPTGVVATGSPTSEALAEAHQLSALVVRRAQNLADLAAQALDHLDPGAAKVLLEETAEGGKVEEAEWEEQEAGEEEGKEQHGAGSGDQMAAAVDRLVVVEQLLSQLCTTVLAIGGDEAAQAASVVAMEEELEEARNEVAQLLESYQEVRTRSKRINESLAEKKQALEESIAREGDLETALEEFKAELAQERDGHQVTREQLSKLADALDKLTVEFDLKQRQYMADLAQAQAATAAAEAGAEVEANNKTLRRKNSKLAKEVRAKGESVEELTSELDTARARAEELEMEAGGLREANRRLEQAAQEAGEDLRNGKQVAIRRAASVQPIVRELESAKLMRSHSTRGDGAEEIAVLQAEARDVLDETMVFLKGALVLITPQELKRMESSLTKYRDKAVRLTALKDMLLLSKRLIILADRRNATGSSGHWELSDPADLDKIPENKLAELLAQLRRAILAYDVMDAEGRRATTAITELMLNLDWIVILALKGLEVEAKRRTSAQRRSTPVTTPGASRPASTKRMGSSGDNDGQRSPRALQDPNLHKMTYSALAQASEKPTPRAGGAPRNTKAKGDTPGSPRKKRAGGNSTNVKVAPTAGSGLTGLPSGGKKLGSSL